jgi:hypothetical protein
VRFNRTESAQPRLAAILPQLEVSTYSAVWQLSTLPLFVWQMSPVICFAAMVVCTGRRVVSSYPSCHNRSK